MRVKKGVQRNGRILFAGLGTGTRAGWSLEIHPERAEPTLHAVRAEVVWSFKPSTADAGGQETPYPLVAWINLFAPEIELRRAVAKMHARIFPLPPFGNVPA